MPIHHKRLIKTYINHPTITYIQYIHYPTYNIILYYTNNHKSISNRHEIEVGNIVMMSEGYFPPLYHHLTLAYYSYNGHTQGQLMLTVIKQDMGSNYAC